MPRQKPARRCLMTVLCGYLFLLTSPLCAQTAALLVVDIQTDFTDNDQYVATTETKALIEAANQVISLFRERDLPVIYTKAELRKMLISPDGEKNIIREASGLHPELEVVGDHIFVKPKADAFQSPEILAFLRTRDVEKIFVIGLMAEDCLSRTALGGIKKGFDTFVVENAVGAFDNESRERYLRKMEKGKVSIIGLEELLESLE